MNEQKKMSVVVVAVGVVWDREGRLLIALRKADAYQGNVWEFPGGKVEKDEKVQDALIRELQEEVGITPVDMTPFMHVEHEYPQRRVLLDVWHVRQFEGTVQGLEGQEIRWVGLDELKEYTFPEGNRAILARLFA